MTSLAVLIPTIRGREDSLERTVNSYAATSTARRHLFIVRDYPTIGAAWAQNLPTITTDLVHLTTDDVTAESDWHGQILEEWDDHDGLAVPLVLKMPEGTHESHGNHWGGTHVHRAETGWCGVPVVPRCCYQACADALNACGCPHYYSDNIICDVVRMHGHTLIARPNYRLGHWWADGGANMSRFADDGFAWQAWRMTRGLPDQFAPASEYPR